MLSESDGEETELCEAEKTRLLLEIHYKIRKKWRKKRSKGVSKVGVMEYGVWWVSSAVLIQVRQFQYLSAGMLLAADRYTEIKRKLKEEKAMAALQREKQKKNKKAEYAMKVHFQFHDYTNYVTHHLIDCLCTYTCTCTCLFVVVGGAQKEARVGFGKRTS